MSKEKDPAYEFLDGVREEFDKLRSPDFPRAVSTPPLGRIIADIEERVECLKNSMLAAYGNRAHEKGQQEELERLFREIAVLCAGTPFTFKMKW